MIKSHSPAVSGLTFTRRSAGEKKFPALGRSTPGISDGLFASITERVKSAHFQEAAE
jgi:hypothetical protein